jgi:hypothetical protein
MNVVATKKNKQTNKQEIDERLRETLVPVMLRTQHHQQQQQRQETT